jgi:hypothetical protein
VTAEARKARIFLTLPRVAASGRCLIALILLVPGGFATDRWAVRCRELLLGWP